jgi:gamma-glutamyltranspeptidase
MSNVGELFGRVSRELQGSSLDDVLMLTVHMQANALRMAYAKRKQADQKLSELQQTTQELLDKHYASNGERRVVFPSANVPRTLDG